MNGLENIHKLFFAGIGGIGMSALARYMMRQGFHVSGYDRNPGEMARRLEREGVPIHYGDDSSEIPAGIDLCIYTPAIPADSGLFQTARQRNIPCMKRAGLLGHISRQKRLIAVAGSHGKTTLSTMLAHIFFTAGRSFDALVGGLSLNYDSNYIFRGKNSEYLIVEADEYDRSFLQLYPEMLLITSVDNDHLDVYKSQANILAAFHQLIGHIHPDGLLIVHEKLQQAFPDYSAMLYGSSQKCDFRITGNELLEDKQCFTMAYNKANIDLSMTAGGMHNLENALGAASLAIMAGISPVDIASALQSYRGVYRRFEKVYQDESIVYIDDYAHHPREIDACISAVRQLYPGKQISAVFQPHLFSRTRDLAQEFAQSMSGIDRLWMLDIYPAREKAIAGIDSGWLLDQIPVINKKRISPEKLPAELPLARPGVLLSMGAGDIDTHRAKFAAALKDSFSMTKDD